MTKALTPGILLNPAKFSSFVEAGTSNSVVDDTLTTGKIRSQALKLRNVRGDDIHFVTAPFSGYGTAPNGGSIDITGTVTNHGTMEADDGGSITVHGLVKNTGPLIANGSTITIDTLQGGTASIIDDGTLDFGGRSNTAVDFSGGAGGNLILEDSGAFKGSISGFDDTDMVTLKDLLIGADTRLSYNNGLLRVVDSGGIEAKLDFGSGYTISNFTLGHDTDGHVTIEHHV